MPHGLFAEHSEVGWRAAEVWFELKRVLWGGQDRLREGKLSRECRERRKGMNSERKRGSEKKWGINGRKRL